MRALDKSKLKSERAAEVKGPSGSTSKAKITGLNGSAMATGSSNIKKPVMRKG